MITTKINKKSNSIESIVNQLSKAYSTLINNKISLSTFPSVMLWGAPGVGKSQGVRQLAKEIENKTNKKVVVTDVRLLLFNPVDLRGIPTSNADKTLAVWLKPKIFQMDESEEIVNILFLDEISAAPQSVQAAAYQITLDKTIGEHKLPENCIVIAAGNRVTDKSVAYTMPKALSNRLCHFTVDIDFNSWRNWAIKNLVNEKVIGFLDCNKDLLSNFDSECEDFAFATPRSWEMVSNVLNNVDPNIENVFSIISGCVGENLAYLFKDWVNNINEKIPKVEEIFNSDYVGVPFRPESLYALSESIIKYINTNAEKIDIDKGVKYVNKMPVEFKNKIFNDLLKNRKLIKKLKNNYDFNFWFLSKGNDWDDYD